MKTNFLSSSKFKITIDKKQLLKEIVANNSRITNQLVKEYIEPRESSAVPYPLYAGIAWYVTLGLAFASFRGFYSTPIFFVYHYLVKSSQS